MCYHCERSINEWYRPGGLFPLSHSRYVGHWVVFRFRTHRIRNVSSHRALHLVSSSPGGDKNEEGQTFNGQGDDSFQDKTEGEPAAVAAALKSNIKLSGPPGRPRQTLMLGLNWRGEGFSTFMASYWLHRLKRASDWLLLMLCGANRESCNRKLKHQQRLTYLAKTAA